MKTIKVKTYIKGCLQDATFSTDKIIGVRENLERQPYHKAILMTTIGEFQTDTDVNTLNHKIKWAE